MLPRFGQKALALVSQSPRRGAGSPYLVPVEGKVDEVACVGQNAAMWDETGDSGKPGASAHEIAAWILVGGGLLLVLRLHLLSALLAGLFVFEIVHIAAPDCSADYPASELAWSRWRLRPY